MNREVWALGSGPGHGVGKGPEAGTGLGVQGLRGAGGWIRGQRGQRQEQAEARGPPMIPGQLLGPVPLPSALFLMRPRDWSPAPLPLPQASWGSQPGYLQVLYI